MNPITLKLVEAKYWYIDRFLHRIPMKLAGWLPRKIKYWVVIHGINQAASEKELESGAWPGEDVTGMDLLDIYDRKEYK